MRKGKPEPVTGLSRVLPVGNFEEANARFFPRRARGSARSSIPLSPPPLPQPGHMKHETCSLKHERRQHCVKRHPGEQGHAEAAGAPAGGLLAMPRPQGFSFPGLLGKLNEEMLTFRYTITGARGTSDLVVLDGDVARASNHEQWERTVTLGWAGLGWPRQ